jgi:DNA-binding MarR family transcriptional regulator
MNATAALTRPVPPADVEELVDSVHHVMRGVLHRLHPALEAEGISMGQFWSMHLVSSLGSASMGTVARHLSLSAPTVCASIDSLEAAGLVARRRSQRDRRAVELSLTPKGRRVEARIWARVGSVMSEAARGVPTDDIAAALRVFREVHTRLETVPAGGPT